MATALHAQTGPETAETIPETPGGWQVILADPPWRERPYSWTTGSNRAVERHYGTMVVEDICAMGEVVKKRAARDSMLFLWVTWPFLNRAEEVARAWGFRYSSGAWVWVKGEVEPQAPVVALNGAIYDPGPALKLRHGRGHTTRKATELCLLFRRGKGLPRMSMNVSDVILDWPEGRNSRKPAEQYKRIAEFLGPVSRPDVGQDGLRCLEMFARPPARAAGWAVWGNEHA